MVHLNNDSIINDNSIFKLVVKPFWKSTMSDQTVELNKEVNLNCDADGSPKPKTRFEKISKKW